MLCENRRRRRAGRRAQITRGRAYARAGLPVRTGWFAHHCGVSRCGQIFVPVRPSTETMWRGRGDE